MGFQRASRRPQDRGRQSRGRHRGAMDWVLDLFDKPRSAPATSPTVTRRSAPARARSSGPVPGRSTATCSRSSISRTYLFPKIGNEQLTYFEMGGMELYTQADKGRHEATMQAVKWLSDNSFLWTTVGRGASPRKSILEPARLQDRRPPLVGPGRLHGRHGVRDPGRDPGAWPAPTSRSIGRQLPGQDAGRRLGEQAHDRGRHVAIQQQWQKGLDAG